MVKTLTISDDVYEELLKLKNGKSFSELLRMLINSYKKKNNNLWIFLMLYKNSDEEFAKNLEKSVEDVRKNLNKIWG